MHRSALRVVHPSSSHPLRRTLSIESLESRALLAGDVDGPTFTSAPLDVTIPENSGQVIGTVTASHPNNVPLTFRVSGGPDATKFSIDQTTGAVSFSGGDYETQMTYSGQIAVSDGEYEASQPVTVTVTDVNERPFVGLANLTSPFENSAEIGGVKVADIVIFDDALGDEVLTLSTQDPQLIFEVRNGNELWIKSSTILDYEVDQNCQVWLHIDDPSIPGSPDHNLGLLLGIKDANEPPTVELFPPVKSLPENANTETRLRVSTILVWDDALGTNTLSLSGDDAAAFEIVEQGYLRELYLRAGTVLDAALKASFNVTINVDDEGLGSAPDHSKLFTLSVTRVNDPPQLTLPNSTIDYPENGSPTILATGATLTDDIASFSGGILTLSITEGMDDSADRLGIFSSGSGPDQVNVVGSDVYYEGTPIGSIDSVNNGLAGNPLVVMFNASATVEAVRAVVEHTTFQTFSDNPSTAQRTVEFSVTDSDGGTSNASRPIQVTASNDPPIVGGLAEATYTENSPAIFITPLATVSDPDSANFEGGTLTIAISAGASPLDRLVIAESAEGTTRISVVGTEIFYGDLKIGTYAGGTDTATRLEISLTANAWEEALTALIRSLTFQNFSDRPGTTPRTVSFVLSDGDGGISNKVMATVIVKEVNDAPVTSFGGQITYVEGQLPVKVSSTAIISDADATLLGGGKLTVKITSGRRPVDRLAIRSTATLTTNAGGQVLYNNVVIGTVTGDGGNAPLIVVFNNLATRSLAQLVLRNITYANTSENPATHDRTLWAQLQEADGTRSVPAIKVLSIVARNDAPVLGGISGNVGYRLNGPAVVLASSATVSDVDNANFAGGKLLVRVTEGSETRNRIELGGTLFTIDSSNNVLRSGVVIGTLNLNGGRGLTKFEVTFNDQALPGYVQQLIRALRFRTEGSASIAPRKIAFSISDGSGGISATLSKTVNVASL